MDILRKLQECLQSRSASKVIASDWTECSCDVLPEMEKRGELLFCEGKVACLILAGGQGSRLGAGIPKGMLPVSVVKKKSLFQILLEKVFYAGLKYGHKIPVVIMTSSYNHDDTVLFLSSHRWFGLDPEQIYMIQQGNLPFCDEEGKMLSEEGPDGNGHALHLLYQQGIWDALHEKGVSYLSVIPIDNALADPCDAAFVGFHASKNSEIAIKALQKVGEKEKMGRLACVSGALRIIEYSEKGEERFSLASTGLFSFTMDFIRSLAIENRPMPLHAAYKKYGERFVWKFEYFLFDVFAYAQKIAVLVRPRSSSFSPLKNSDGEDSFATVAQDLLAQDTKRYRELTGHPPEEKQIELSAACYYLPLGVNVSLLTQKSELGWYIHLS